MRIGINLLYLLPGIVGGTETYARGLLGALGRVGGENTYVVFLNREGQDIRLPASGVFERVVCPVAATSRPRRYAFEQMLFPAYLQRHRIDIIHSLGYVGPLRTACRSVVTVPDLNFLAFGRDMPALWRYGFGCAVRAAARRADRIVTISEHSRRELAAWLKIPEERIAVTLLAADSAGDEREPTADECTTFEALKPERPYIVCFSKQSPNKNIPAAIRAVAHMVHHHDWPGSLVLVGHQPATADPGRLSEMLGIRDRVVITGYVPTAVVRQLLRQAQFLLFPSLYEGFGLPVLEAMQLGIPVVCSERASLPEVGGDAAEYFNPESVEDMAAHMMNVSRNEEVRRAMVQRGLRQAAKFSWEATARSTLTVYRSLAPQVRHA